MFTPNNYIKYSRQIMLPGFGELSQQKLFDAKVLVIGAGGLGCPVLQYLTAAGVGEIGIADNDIVGLTNLHRQILFGVDDVGKPKATTAAARLKEINHDVKFTVYDTRLTTKNAWDIFAGYNVVIDGSDNFPTRYLVNDLCVLQNKPLIYGSVFRYEGQVAVFNYAMGAETSSNYRDIFPNPPLESEVPNCSEAGVLGVLPGIVGNLMANETIKVITGIGVPLTNALLTYNSLTNQFFEISLSKDKKGTELIPKNRQSFEARIYEDTCLPSVASIIEIEADEFDEILNLGDVEIFDVREAGETPSINEFKYAHFPLSNLLINPVVPHADTIVVFCQSGKRSKQAAAIIAANNNISKIYSLKGGIQLWKSLQIKQEKHEQ